MGNHKITVQAYNIHDPDLKRTLFPDMGKSKYVTVVDLKEYVLIQQAEAAYRAIELTDKQLTKLETSQ